MATDDRCGHRRPEPGCAHCLGAAAQTAAQEFRDRYEVRLARLTRNLREDLRDEWEARNRARVESGFDPLPLPDFLSDRSSADSDTSAIGVIAAVVACFLVLALLVGSCSGKRGDKRKADTPPSAEDVLQRA